MRRRFGPGVSGLGGLVLATALLGLAAPASAQTLTEALANAYVSNPTLDAARAALRVTNEEVPQALSNWRPTVTVTGSIGQQRIDLGGGGGGSTTVGGTTFGGGGGDGAETITPRSVDLNVTQPLFRGGRTVAETRRAEANIMAQRARLQTTEQDILFRAATAYMDVWRDQSVLELNLNNENVLRRQLEASEDRFEVGEVTRTDVAQSESRLSRATGDRVQAEGNLTTSRAIFEELVGQAPQILEAPPTVEAMRRVCADEPQAHVAPEPRADAIIRLPRKHQHDAADGDSRQGHQGQSPGIQRLRPLRRGEHHLGRGDRERERDGQQDGHEQPQRPDRHRGIRGPTAR